MAKGRVRQALKLTGLRPNPAEFPALVLEVFNTQVLIREGVRKKKGAIVFLMLGGVGVASAVGIATASKDSPPAMSEDDCVRSITAGEADATLQTGKADSSLPTISGTARCEGDWTRIYSPWGRTGAPVTLTRQ